MHDDPMTSCQSNFMLSPPADSIPATKCYESTSTINNAGKNDDNVALKLCSSPSEFDSTPETVPVEQELSSKSFSKSKGDSIAVPNRVQLSIVSTPSSTNSTRLESFASSEKSEPSIKKSTMTIAVNNYGNNTPTSFRSYVSTCITKNIINDGQRQKVLKPPQPELSEDSDDEIIVYGTKCSMAPRMWRNVKNKKAVMQFMGKSKKSKSQFFGTSAHLVQKNRNRKQRVRLLDAVDNEDDEEKFWKDPYETFIPQEQTTLAAAEAPCESSSGINNMCNKFQRKTITDTDASITSNLFAATILEGDNTIGIDSSKSIIFDRNGFYCPSQRYKSPIEFLGEPLSPKRTQSEKHDSQNRQALRYLQMARARYQELVNAIIRPPRAEYRTEALGPPAFTFCGSRFTRTDFTLCTKRGMNLECSHWEPVERTFDRIPVVIYMHGNFGSRVEVIPQLSYLLSLGLAVFAFDFAGSGKSDGEYVSLGYFEREDLMSVIAHLRATNVVSTIALWGRSMGAATALMHGDRDPSIACMILDSSFADLTQLAEEMVEKGKEQGISVPNFIVSVAIRCIQSSVKRQANFNIQKISPVAHADKCFIPALFVAGEHDDFIHKRHSQAIHDKYAGDKDIIIVEGDHNSPRSESMFHRVGDFLQRYLGIPSSWALKIPAGSILSASPWLCPVEEQRVVDTLKGSDKGKKRVRQPSTRTLNFAHPDS